MDNYKFIIIGGIIIIIIVGFYFIKNFNKQDIQPTTAGGTVGGGTSVTTTSPFIGCFSDSTNAFNGKSFFNKSVGYKTVKDCNDAARNANVTFFGMSYWQSSDPNKGNDGTANCLWATPDRSLTLIDATAFQGAPGGNKNNAPNCPANGPFTKECISQDQTKGCVSIPDNKKSTAPPGGKLGGGWINAIYNTY